MNYLIDTHILIWHTEKNSIVSKNVVDLIENPANTIYVSMISLFEIVIKQSIKKIDSSKPMFHRDPFDRILIAQAIAENLTIITHDKIFKQYDVKSVI